MITLILAVIFPEADWEPFATWYIAMFEILFEAVVIGALLSLVA